MKVGRLYNIKMANKTEKKNQTTIILAIVAVVAVFIFAQMNPSQAGEIEAQDLDEEGLTQWQKNYRAAALDLPTYNTMIKNTDYYQLDDPLIKNVAEDIARNSPTTLDAIKNTLDHVFDEVNYDFNEPDEPCLKSNAPDILKSGTGQCDTQSIVVIAILREMGIAAVPVGGCVVPDSSCKLQSVLLNANIKLPGAPKYNEIEDIDIEAEQFSRRFSRTGGLHAWVTAWVPGTGWVELEPTAGRLADLKCYTYHVELYPTNENREDICVTKSYNYAKACKESNINLLNDNGLGNAGDVSP